MASAFSHALVAVMVGQSFQAKKLTWRELLVGVLCSVVPDLDVVGFHFSVPYDAV